MIGGSTIEMGSVLNGGTRRGEKKNKNLVVVVGPF